MIVKSQFFTREFVKNAIFHREIVMLTLHFPWSLFRYFYLEIYDTELWNRETSWRKNMKCTIYRYFPWKRRWIRYLYFKFSTATPTKYHNQINFVCIGFPFPLKQQKNMGFPRLALSVTCTNTPRLSAGDCLRDAGSLAFSTSELQLIWVFTGIGLLSWTCGNIITRLSLHVSVNDPTVIMWCQRDMASIPRSHTCATASKLIVPYLEAFPGYVQPMSKQVTSICGEHIICPCRPCV